MGAAAFADTRAGRARAALRRAEELTGATAASLPRPEVLPRVTRPEPSPGTPPESSPGPRAEPLPVAPGLRALVPALVRGQVHMITGSTSLTLALLAEASRAGSWLAVVGQDRLGVLAAEQLGIDLTRLALVPAPGPDAALVVAALLDGMDMVLVGPRAALTDGDRRRLTARARDRGVVLLSTVDWPGAHLRLTATPSSWDGLGRGHGRLRSRTLAVTRTGRGRAGAGETLMVDLPGSATSRQDADRRAG